MSETELCAAVIDAFEDESDPAELELETTQHLATLIELGAISPFAEQAIPQIQDQISTRM